jgi:hypothetical protein
MSGSVTRFQSGSGTCTVPSALGGGLISDLEKQLKSLMSSTKKTVKKVKGKVTAKRKPATKKKSPAKRKPATKKKSPAKRKPATKKKSPAKRKPATKKKSPAKRKPATKKKSPAKRKPLKGGVTPRPRVYYLGGDNLTTKGNEFKNKMNLIGGGSSDFIGTVSSRGPVNYPSPEGSGMSGEQLFRTFNKTGVYMPHEQVNYGSVLTDGILGTKLTGGRRMR